MVFGLDCESDEELEMDVFDRNMGKHGTHWIFWVNMEPVEMPLQKKKWNPLKFFGVFDRNEAKGEEIGSTFNVNFIILYN